MDKQWASGDGMGATPGNGKVGAGDVGAPAPLPCPFCGEAPHVDGNRVIHACVTLGVDIETRLGAWNTRCHDSNAATPGHMGMGMRGIAAGIRSTLYDFDAGTGTDLVGRRGIHVVFGSDGTLYLSRDSVGRIEEPRGDDGDHDVVLGNCNPGDGSECLAMEICDAVSSSSYLCWLPGDATHDDASDMLTEMWNASCKPGVPDHGIGMGSRLLGDAVTGNCHDIARRLACSNDAVARDAASHVDTIAPDVMLGRLRAMGIACDGSASDDDAIAEAAEVQFRRMCDFRDGPCYAQELDVLVDACTSFAFVLAPLDGDRWAWPRGSSTARRVRERVMGTLRELCDQRGVSMDDAREFLAMTCDCMYS